MYSHPSAIEKVQFRSPEVEVSFHFPSDRFQSVHPFGIFDCPECTEVSPFRKVAAAPDLDALFSAVDLAAASAGQVKPAVGRKQNIGIAHPVIEQVNDAVVAGQRGNASLRIHSTVQRSDENRRENKQTNHGNLM